MFDELLKLSRLFLEVKNEKYRRYFIRNVAFKHRMSLIAGQRGIGKTTTLIQYLLDQVKGDKLNPKILYIQADHFLMRNASLYEIAEQFQAMGGKWLGLDEIHKYARWSQELKSIYDTFPDLTILASGSSALEIYKGSHDLTRRAIQYHMQGLSFREFLEITLNTTIPHYSLEDILTNHEKIALQITEKLAKKKKKVLPLFGEYLKTGYFPYFRELNDPSLYVITLEQNLHTTVESDLVAIYPQLTGNSIQKIKRLLVFIAKAVPFTPNWESLKNLLEIGDSRTLKTYLKYLEDADIIRSVYKASQKMRKMDTPEKIYLSNPNAIYAIGQENQNKGTVRETFFLNMISQSYEALAPAEGDFLVDNTYTFEVGGKKKSFAQIRSKENAFLACDDIEVGVGAKVPLWLFGLLY